MIIILKFIDKELPNNLKKEFDKNNDGKVSKKEYFKEDILQDNKKPKYYFR